MKRKMNLPLLLTTLSLLFTLTGINAQKKGTINHPNFSEFVYQGEDPVYREYPLQSDEFYNPILQG
ncbi:MAG TPA: glycoside hydrolase family 43 protein, partial [Porphyromonadaceae bacterium]|nr:glycoside hydrolase family 43 protein [Porphyromonadaceae bacterium]